MEQAIKRIMSGEARGPGALIMRGALALTEPFYATVLHARNTLYDSRTLPTHRAARPVICVGNITTGGTGKTPIVQWLARQLRAKGHRPAVVLRGYRSRDGASDEEQLLRSSLNNSSETEIPVRAGANRVVSARALLAINPQTDVILLDDGFQHRRLARDLDLVLIDATNPFGFNHVLPRGLLREPIEGLARAGAFLITRSDQVTKETMASTYATLRAHNTRAPIFPCRHVLSSIANSEEDRIEPQQLRGRRVWAFCGIGNPQSFEHQITQAGAIVLGGWEFVDHYHYTEDDLVALAEDARNAGADALITTEKDWVKIAAMAGRIRMPIWRALLRIEFDDEDRQRLMDQVERTISMTTATAPLPGHLEAPSA